MSKDLMLYAVTKLPDGTYVVQAPGEGMWLSGIGDYTTTEGDVRLAKREAPKRVKLYGEKLTTVTLYYIDAQTLERLFE